MSCGWATPCLRRRSLRAVPSAMLQYSTRSAAAWMPRVPRLTAIIGWTRASSAHRMNSLSPNRLLADQVEHVGAQTLLVGPRVPGLEDAGVHAPTHVFDERAEEPGIDRRYRVR